MSIEITIKNKESGAEICLDDELSMSILQSLMVIKSLSEQDFQPWDSDVLNGVISIFCSDED